MLHPPAKPGIDSIITFATVAALAETDLRAFFLECANPTDVVPLMKTDLLFKKKLKTWKSMLKKAVDKVKYYDSNFPADTDELGFLEDLLPWLDDRKAGDDETGEPKLPWTQAGTKREIGDKDISNLLNLFQTAFLDKLCTPRLLDEPGQEEEVLDKSNLIMDGTANIWLLKYFIRYVGMSGKLDGKKWDVRWYQVKKDYIPAVKKTSFLSWLLVDYVNNTLYILYDQEAMMRGVRNKYEVSARFEATLLHELGHAVNHLDWYKIAPPNYRKMGSTKFYGHSGWISSPAWHEFEAWAYALTIRSCIKSTRSWITVLVEGIDNESLSL